MQVAHLRAVWELCGGRATVGRRRVHGQRAVAERLHLRSQVMAIHALVLGAPHAGDVVGLPRHVDEVLELRSEKIEVEALVYQEKERRRDAHQEAVVGRALARVEA